MTIYAPLGSAISDATTLEVGRLKTRIETALFQESRDFYTRHFGMKVLESWEKEGDKGVVLGLDSSIGNEALLEIAYVESPNAYKALSLQFRVPDICSAAEKLRGRLKFRGPVERPWGSKYIYLQDPSGVEIVLYEGIL